MRHSLLAFALVLLLLPPAARGEIAIQAYALPTGGGPHDVAVGADGIAWYTAQRDGKLGRLDPTSGKVDLVSLGRGAAPHGVVIGPDGAPWVTEGGTNAIVRVDPQTREVKSWPLPEARGYVNLNTLTFDKRGRVWFTGQNGVYGRLDPKSGAVQVWDAPRGPCGRTPRAASGSASGMPAMSVATTPGPGPGRPGSYPASIREPTPCTSMTRTWCGSPTGGRTPWSASTPRRKSSRRSRATAAAPTCARSSAGRARCGCRSPAPTGSWSIG